MNDCASAGLEGFGVARVSALTDGVFAVVLTLLVINLRPPAAANNAQLWGELRALAPSLLEFVVTFTVVSIFWYGHNMESHWIRRTDRIQLMITLMLLLTICFLPFTETLLERNDRLPLALTVYGANLGLAGLCRLAHWSHATRGKRLVDESMDPGLIRHVRRVFSLVVLLYLVAIALAWLSTIAALVGFALIPILYVRPSPHTRHLTSLARARPKSAEDQSSEDDQPADSKARASPALDFLQMIFISPPAGSIACPWMVRRFRLSFDQPLLTRAKNYWVSAERTPRAILTGPLRGITMSLDLRTQTQLYLGLYERETFPWIRHFCHQLNSAVDIGVAEGEFTLLFLTRTAAAAVWAFEPDPSVRPLFETNLQLNGVRDSTRLNRVESFAGDGTGAGEMRLDALADRLRSPCLIKVDAEGAEARILRGARGLNTLGDLRWLIETHSQQLERECAQSLTDAGFTTQIIPQAPWRKLLPDYRPLEQNRWLAAWKRSA